MYQLQLYNFKIHFFYLNQRYILLIKMGFVTDIIFDDFGTSSNLAAALNSTFEYDNIRGFSSVSFYLEIPTNATVIFEASNNGTNWFSISFQNISSGKSINTTSFDGDYTGSILGFRKWRVRVSVGGSVAGSVIGRTIRESIGSTVDKNKSNQQAVIVQFDESSTTAFGEGTTAQLNAIIQLTFPYNVNTRLVNTMTSGSGSVTSSPPFVVVGTGTTANSEAHLYSNKAITYRAGIGILTRFTAIFNAGNVNNKSYIGLGTETNGVFIGYNGTNFGVLRKSDGIDYWTNQTDWNVDTMDGLGPSQMILDTTKGNVYQIKFQWLGFGQLTYFIEDPNTGKFVVVHKEKYANSNTTTSLKYPSFPFHIDCKNSNGATSNNLIKVPSAAVFYEGQNERNGILNSRSNEISPASTGQKKMILSIRNKTTVFGGQNNHSQIEVRSITYSNNTNKNVKFGLLLNPTSISGATYTDVDTNTSVVDFSTNGTTITGGIELYSATLSPGNSGNVELVNTIIDIFVGDIITLFTESFQKTNGECSGSMTWGEIIG